MEAKELIRLGPPNEFDQFEYGTRIVVYSKNKVSYELWLQLGLECEPNWEYMGVFKTEDKYKGDH